MRYCDVRQREGAKCNPHWYERHRYRASLIGSIGLHLILLWIRLGDVQYSNIHYTASNRRCSILHSRSPPFKKCHQWLHGSVAQEHHRWAPHRRTVMYSKTGRTKLRKHLFGNDQSLNFTEVTMIVKQSHSWKFDSCELTLSNFLLHNPTMEDGWFIWVNFYKLTYINQFFRTDFFAIIIISVKFQLKLLTATFIPLTISHSCSSISVNLLGIFLYQQRELMSRYYWNQQYR